MVGLAICYLLPSPRSTTKLSNRLTDWADFPLIRPASTNLYDYDACPTTTVLIQSERWSPRRGSTPGEKKTNDSMLGFNAYIRRLAYRMHRVEGNYKVICKSIGLESNQWGKLRILLHEVICFGGFTFQT